MGNEKTTHLVANRIPRNIRTKIVSIWHGNDSHKTLVRLRARRFVEYVLRGPVDELGPATIFTDTGVVKMRFDPGGLVGGALDSRRTRFVLAAGPEAVER